YFFLAFFRRAFFFFGAFFAAPFEAAALARFRLAFICSNPLCRRNAFDSMKVATESRMELQSSGVELRIFVTEGCENRVESSARGVFDADFPANRAPICACTCSRGAARRARERRDAACACAATVATQMPRQEIAGRRMRSWRDEETWTERVASLAGDALDDDNRRRCRSRLRRCRGGDTGSACAGNLPGGCKSR
ncbi:MAG TPA: hypothetical protein VJO12_10120, partial [Stellaceae bacterium]|nr:hypothetical protein [Stellaceae bacterium]